MARHKNELMIRRRINTECAFSKIRGVSWFRLLMLQSVVSQEMPIQREKALGGRSFECTRTVAC